MMLTLLVTSKGVAGVPRASLVVLAGTLSSFGLPLEGVAVILGVDELMDMARTTVNVVGNCLAAAVVARWEGEFGPVGDRRSARPAARSPPPEPVHQPAPDHDSDPSVRAAALVAALSLLLRRVAAQQAAARPGARALGAARQSPLRGDLRFRRRGPADARRSAVSFDVGGPGPGAAVVPGLDARLVRALQLRAVRRRLHRHRRRQGAGLGQARLRHLADRPGGRPQRSPSASTIGPTRSTTRAAWSRPDFAFFNGTNVFPYPEGRGSTSPRR